MKLPEGSTQPAGKLRGAERASPLWTCPHCGRRFVSRNKQHSCGHYRIDDHFAGKDPIVRELFDHLLGAIQQFGPVTAYALKTRIVFQAETQFAAAMTRRHWLEGYLWLRRRAEHPVIQRIEMHVFRDYGHIFRLTRPGDLDEALVALLHEAYVLGCQAPPGRR
jgi:uncharacterized protein DUF5655